MIIIIIIIIITAAAKIIFNKHWSDVKILSQVKTTRWIYVLHNLQGHLSVFQFIILDLNVDKNVSSL